MARHDAPDPDDERIAEEIAFHIEQQTDKLRRAWLPLDRARRQARLMFGGVEAMKESARDQRRFSWMRGLGGDLRHAARGLRRAPAFSTLVVLTLGLGIAASTALFSVVQAVLLRDLPYPGADRIVRLMQINTDGTPDGPARRVTSASEANVIDWRQRTRSFSAIATMASWGPQPVSGGREPVMASVTAVSREFLAVMGVPPAAGRWFVDAEQREGGERAALISRGLRWRVFGDTLPAGASLRVNSQTFVVIGEMPPGFDYPNATDVWIPAELEAASTERTAHNVQAIARVGDHATVSAAAAEISAVSRRLRDDLGDQTWMVDATAVPLLELTTGAVKPALRLLFGAACLLFAIACANVANLLLARAASRRQAVAIQLAMGASRWRVVRQRLMEILLVCLGAGLAGIVMARFVVAGVVSLDPGTIARLQDVGLDWTSVAFALGVSLIATMGIGLITAWRSSDRDLGAVLGDAARTSTGGRRAERARQLLVVSQVGVTVVLLAGTALLGRSFLAVMRIDPGYRTDRVTVLDLVIARGPERDARQRQWMVQQEFLQRLQAVPGVTAAGLINGLPAGGRGNYANGQFLEMSAIDELASRAVVARLGPKLRDRAGFAGFRVVGGDYFRTMRIPILEGRAFEDGDTADAPHVAVISESLARARWAGRDALGRFVQFGNMDGDMRGFRIVGVAGDVRELTPEASPGPLFYVDYRQRPGQGSRVSYVVEGGGAEIGATAQRMLREIAPSVPMQARALDDAFDASLRGRRFNLLLITVFGAAALVLAVAGTYGLISVLVAQRRREIGIRLAIGAGPASVIALVTWQGARLAIAGAAAGLVAARLLTGLVDGLLFSVTPADPAMLGLAAVLTSAAVIAASIVPAWRAASIAPVETLRRVA